MSLRRDRPSETRGGRPFDVRLGDGKTVRVSVPGLAGSVRADDREREVGDVVETPDNLSVDDRVSVRDNERTKAAGTAGQSGTIAGVSRVPDVPTGKVVAYAVVMDGDGRAWMVEPEDLDPA